MTTIDNVCLVKTSNKYHCLACDYSTQRKYNFEIHLESIKHKNNALTTNDNAFLVKTSNKYNCQCCEKIFNDRAGLWRHKKKCNNITEENMVTTDKDLVMMLIKENTELKNMMMKVLENGTTNNSNNTTNSHNKAFNLNLFLNETCKDAMNITDFVESIKLQLTDLERVGELGYIEGISNIIVKNLKELDVTQRPVHCTDKKRETMYVKDENTWEKDEEKKKMHKLVKKVADKNMRLLPEYREKYPDYIKASSLCSDKYNQMFLESLGGSGDNNYEKEEKIIQKVSREVFVQKDL
jgi:hypothetical protein